MTKKKSKDKRIFFFERRPDSRGGWANYYATDGRIAPDGYVYDAPGAWSDDPDKSEEIWDDIQQAIYEGKDEIKTHGLHINWFIEDDEE